MLVHSIFCIFPAISGHFWLTDRSLWSDPNSEVSEYFFRCPPLPPSSQDARQPRCRASSNILSVRKSYLVTSAFCRSLSTAVFERTQWTRFVGINRHVATRIQRTCSLKSSSCLGWEFPRVWFIYIKRSLSDALRRQAYWQVIHPYTFNLNHFWWHRSVRRLLYFLHPGAAKSLLHVQHISHATAHSSSKVLSRLTQDHHSAYIARSRWVFQDL